MIYLEAMKFGAVFKLVPIWKLLNMRILGMGKASVRLGGDRRTRN